MPETKISKANFADYLEIQGGRPNITQDNGGLWHIRHQYRDDEPDIVTHISPEERGTVVLDTTRGPRLFEVSSLWQFEGQPCETRSSLEGGHGYDRTGENKG